MNVLTVIGARPQFIKACMLSRALKSYPEVNEIIVHTGQHYDASMSDVFFEQLKLPKPDYYLGIGSGTHALQTGKMLMELEKIMTAVNPDMVVVYGDTNSTLAGSLAASKLHTPIAHIESGLRSFNRKMPEEINRVVTDHLSDWLFCPSRSAAENLKREGMEKQVFVTGDIMYDAVRHFKSFAGQQSTILQELSLSENNYYLATIHRAENTDDPNRLKAILEGLMQLKKRTVLPSHPRTKRKIDEFKLNDIIDTSHIKMVEPLSYFDTLTIASNANVILTDSGGLQKEAYMLQVPCITLRDETEWMETVKTGWNRLAGANKEQIADKVMTCHTPEESPPIFGDGNAAQQIAGILINGDAEN
ncbi:non-hydrolyzing UDP-N-acetylglucosamine 2-epimerase [Lentibacillus sp. CBA3610]|uniref:non-hydrolyzing UDP-N-acetylglucosamine 2-epimerase n=1 Tax=Lentibacillus sp. CBA3610 TaxID=2518176 RepID=UPI0015963189|nr:UDP-N-acetylglucosamine 2-epimerase (non-hydrolyzing) [Lentibacillus sp. CBA3610]QKY71106.1 UDP-N-acetylglucosamine 2-epimerase (non-hydrolyzing) [Lentibacillus sp. CBA3610]